MSRDRRFLGRDHPTTPPGHDAALLEIRVHGESPNHRSDDRSEPMAHRCKCGREWTGINHAHCASGCHEHFSSVAHFDAHRRDGTCRYPGHLTDRHGEPLLRASVNRFGITWVSAKEHPKAAERRAREAEDDAA